MKLHKPMDSIFKTGNFPLLWLSLTVNAGTMIMLKD